MSTQDQSPPLRASPKRSDPFSPEAKSVMDHEDDEALPPYVQIERTDILVRCQRCGAVVEGDVLGQNLHNIWHDSLDRRIADAARWRPAPRYAGRTAAGGRS